MHGPVVTPSTVDKQKTLEIGEAGERVVRRENGLLALLAPDADPHVRRLPKHSPHIARPSYGGITVTSSATVSIIYIRLIV